jgi:hypothetical protein
VRSKITAELVEMVSTVYVFEIGHKTGISTYRLDLQSAPGSFEVGKAKENEYIGAMLTM